MHTGSVMDLAQYLMFKGKPLVRSKNSICYGDMNEDKYILFILILSNKTIETTSPPMKVDIPDKVLVQILSTDKSKPAHERIAKQFDKTGLYDAMDIGLIWLDKLNKNEGA